ncbi:hypothetical protein GCM10010123_42770 [Pilimelia anulata]|uniref:Uncharacterized protein n=1 Tax=Pilimelia anulata TaxID=53371 RepID=A0A8J3BB08_9ACTN|nr:hypothetical protein [Pilimelia anulata]GGK08267.1 hypothetical protein GCM10010123_42770 [Pilimelia anulata]
MNPTAEMPGVHPTPPAGLPEGGAAYVVSGAAYPPPAPQQPGRGPLAALLVLALAGLCLAGGAVAWFVLTGLPPR